MQLSKNFTVGGSCRFPFFAFVEKINRVGDSAKLCDVVYGNFTPLMVGLTGLEPVTLRLSSACSNQLSYRPVEKPCHY